MSKEEKGAGYGAKQGGAESEAGPDVEGRPAKLEYPARDERLRPADTMLGASERANQGLHGRRGAAATTARTLHLGDKVEGGHA
ncbi:unnamed protein product [Tilletia laevis]|uniref:Uncharacterized protein n=1 Tax=Tilletia laevis TaxID=157183 RepID=A0A9N8LPT1_9BASI|nr:unnamed protein product [Tilletia laevis]